MKRGLIAVMIAAGGVWWGGCAGGPGKGGGPEARGEGVVHHVSAADMAGAKSAAPIEGMTAVLWVNGLGCPLCATNIDKQLVRVDGVDSVDVDLSNGKVTLLLKPGAAHPSPAVLGAAVEDAGFTLVKVEGK